MGDLFKKASKCVKEMDLDELKKYEDPMTKVKELMSQMDDIKDKITKLTNDKKDNNANI